MTVTSSALPPPLCPQCGGAMASIAIETTAPPYVVELRGCARCGITANELRDAGPNADTIVSPEISPP